MSFKQTRDVVGVVHEITVELMAADNKNQTPHDAFDFNKVEHKDSTR